MLHNPQWMHTLCEQVSPCLPSKSYVLKIPGGLKKSKLNWLSPLSKGPLLP